MTTYAGTVTQSWVSYEFIWHTAMDDKVCPFCDKLEGQIWTGDKVTGILVHPDYGSVWDLDADRSLAHPWDIKRGESTCRCFLEVRPIVELENIESVKILRSTLTEFGYMPSNIEEAKAEVSDLETKILAMDMTTRQFERLMYRMMALSRKFGLPENINQEIILFERAVMIARQLSMSMAFLEMATPYGWLMGIAGFAISGFSAVDLFLSS